MVSQIIWRRNVAYLLSAIWCVAEKLLLRNGSYHISSSGIMPEDLFRFSTGRASGYLMGAVYIVMLALAVGGIFSFKSEYVLLQSGGKPGIRAWGVRVCIGVMIGLSVLDAWAMCAVNCWWGILFPAIMALLLWNLYRALYPKSAPAKPENE